MSVHDACAREADAMERCSEVPCLCMPLFLLFHPDKPGNTRYAIFSFPRHAVFVIVSSDKTWRAFGRGTDTYLLALKCTPVYTIPLLTLDYSSFDNLIASNQGAVAQMPGFVDALVDARLRELGLPVPTQEATG